MKKMYLGVILTVVGSLVLLGALLDQWDSENNQRQEPNVVAIYQKILFGISEQLVTTDTSSLVNKTNVLAKHFSLDLQLTPLASVAIPASFLGVLQEEQSIVLESDTKLIIFHIVKNHPNVFLKLTLPVQQQDSYFLDMAMTLVLYAGIALMLFFWLLPLTTRLHKLTELAAEVGSGNLTKRVRLSKFSYIDSLEKSFNHMASRIETLVADNKILAGSLSHDLRTPLACLRFGVEAAMDTNDQKKQLVYLKRVGADLTRLEEMLEAFLEYASLEQNGINLVKRDINFYQLVLSVVKELQPLANDAKIGVFVTLNMDAETTIYADNHWVYRALLNVLSNALEHASSRINVDISRSENDTVILAVNDDGCGIGNIDNAILFTPFSKGDESRNLDQQHYGLGLAIVSKVMEWHNGSVCANESSSLKGACFTMNLPLN